ncbi:MAG TPA: MerR family transcriptional regulator [Nitrospiria bacterium]|jgi:DNA-binding transcriptional MerR regulator
MGIEKRFFTQAEVCEIVGISQRQIQYWGTSGLFLSRFKTRGGHTRYSFEDLIAYKTAKKLLDSGISLQRIRKSLANLQSFLPKIKSPLSELTLVASGEVILVLYENTLFEAISGQEWIIHLSDLKRDVENWVERSQKLKLFRKKRNLLLRKEGSKKKVVSEKRNRDWIKSL